MSAVIYIFPASAIVRKAVEKPKPKPVRKRNRVLAIDRPEYICGTPVETVWLDLSQSLGTNDLTLEDYRRFRAGHLPEQRMLLPGLDAMNRYMETLQTLVESRAQGY